MKQLLDEARKIIRINSVTSHGNEELANYVSELLQDHGLKVQLQQVTHSLENVSKRQFNVIGILGDPLVDKKTRKGLLLSTHLDTVSAGLSENWTETGGDPFNAAVRDGKIYGLGSADVKIDFLCKLYAASKFRERKLKHPIYLVGTCGEEMGMFGAKYLIKSLALNPKFVVVGQPTELKLVYAHKSLNIFRVSVDYQMTERDARGFNRRVDIQSFGRSAHGAYPQTGVNSIGLILDFLQGATAAGFEIRFTGISGGDSKNKVPDSSSCSFFLTSHQFEDFKRFFREWTRTKGLERNFRAELGGLGDAGVRFLPENLFLALMEIVEYFRVLSGEFRNAQDPTFNPPHSTVSFAMLTQNPARMDLHFDLRLLPNVSPEQIQARISEDIKAIAARYAAMNISVTRERMNPGLEMTPKHELVEVCKAALQAAELPVELSKMSTSTEAAQFFQAGFESVLMGPGVSLGNSHAPNEHCLLDQIEKSVNFYQKLIERVCL